MEAVIFYVNNTKSPSLWVLECTQFDTFHLFNPDKTRQLLDVCVPASQQVSEQAITREATAGSEGCGVAVL